ncbi:hypothetical protein BGX38DRAFT_1174282, partial [Terfezia claveryi]
IAFILNAQGQYGKALEYYERALAGKEKALGVHHPSTKNTILDLIKLYIRSGQIKQALNLVECLGIPRPTVQSQLLMLARCIIVIVSLFFFVGQLRGLVKTLLGWEIALYSGEVPND